MLDVRIYSELDVQHAQIHIHEHRINDLSEKFYYKNGEM